MQQSPAYYYHLQLFTLFVGASNSTKMLMVGKDNTVHVRTVFFFMLIFGFFQVIFLFEMFYARPYLHNGPQCDCKCTKQLSINTAGDSSRKNFPE